jgi:hypothetical protein
MLYYLTIVLISSATILFELALLRLFAVQQFYHFAFMAISLALLGAGASGSILSVHGRRYSPALMSLFFAITTIGAYLVINYLPFDSFSIAWDGRQIWYLAGYFLAAAVPFLFSGLVIGSELMVSGQDELVNTHPNPGLHQVYGANLIGSAFGSLASLLILNVFGGEGAVIIATMLGALSSLGFAWHVTNKGQLGFGQQATKILAFVLLLASLVALFRPPELWAQRLSPYKTLSVLTQAYDARHVLTTWDATARIDIVESGTIHIMPGLSLQVPSGLPLQAGLMLDGDNLMPITKLAPDSKQAKILADYLPNGLALRLRPGARTLVIESGTGMDVLFALAGGASSVTAVEKNGLVNKLIADDYGIFTKGLYKDSRVEVVDRSGRVFVQSDEFSHQASSGYDVAVVALTDPHRPVSSGAYSLTENYVYTVEAIGDYIQALNENGLLVITRWLQTPPSESVRTFATLATALKTQGADPAEHLVAFRTLRTMTFLVGKRPFADQEITTVRDFLGQRGFDAVYFPGIRTEDLNQYNLLAEAIYHELFEQILADPETVYTDYRFDIRPATDNRPFFFHYFKWRQAPEIIASLGLTWQPFGGSGYFVLVALLILVALASTVLILAPLLLRPKDKSINKKSVMSPLWRIRVFTYFACLGLAFLFIEVPLAQHFILLFDQPVIALAIVLFALLLFSGLGSLTVPRWPLPLGLGMLVILIALYPLLLEGVTAISLGQPGWIQILLTILSIAPLGYLMGLPFSGGLQLVERRQPSLVPWAWAINGSFSVVSSVLAVMIALSWGFPIVFWLGAAAYTGALVAFGGLWKN